MSRLCEVARIAWATLCASTCLAHANEKWTCIKAYDNGKNYMSEFLIAEDRLIFEGGNGAYTIFQNNKDHVLAALVHKNVDGQVVTFYLLLERASGRLTDFDDLTMVATKGIYGNVIPIARNSECKKN